MMKISALILTRKLNYGGAQRQLIDLVRAMDKSHFDITVAAFYDGGGMQEEMESVDDVRFVSLHKRGRYDVYGFLSRVMELVHEIRPHVILTQNASKIFAFTAGLRYGCRIVLGILNAGADRSRTNRLDTVLFLLDAKIANRADLLISNSFAGRNYYAGNGYPAGRIVVIPNGFDTGRFYPSRKLGENLRVRWGILPGDILIGVVGRLDQRKDHKTFLEAAARISSIYTDVRFVCVGDGEEGYFKSLQDLTRSLGLEGRVIWAGAQTDMPAVYNALDILASTSVCEGLSNVIGEAMSCGVPCIVTEVGDSDFLLGDQMRIAPPNRPDLIADQWKMLISMSPDERRLIGMRNRERIIQNFSLELLALRTEKALSAVVGGVPVPTDQGLVVVKSEGQGR